MTEVIADTKPTCFRLVFDTNEIGRSKGIMPKVCLFEICIFRVMDEKRIDEIVCKVFDKAKKEHASHSKYALSSHIGEQIGLSSKTVERAYDRYINKRKRHGIPQADSVDLFCKYLGFDSFSDYVKKTPSLKTGNAIEKGKVKNDKWIVILVVLLIMVLSFFGYRHLVTVGPEIDSNESVCMTWADSVYVEVSCDIGPLSKFGTEVKPLDKVELKSMKKVRVDAAYVFFGPTGKPLIWYYKNKATEIDYFTAPGLHPVHGETLKKITPYIIETYVPEHRFNANSFVNPSADKK